MGSDRTVDFRVHYMENVLSKTPVLTLKQGLQAQCCVREAVGSEMEADTCPGEDRLPQEPCWRRGSWSLLSDTALGAAAVNLTREEHRGPLGSHV